MPSTGRVTALSPQPSDLRFFLLPMTTQTIPNVTVTTQASVYFDGKCISHGVTLADGSKKSVGVIMPATLSFNTGAPEVMECTGGACEYKLAGSEAWLKSLPIQQTSLGRWPGCDARSE